MGLDDDGGNLLPREFGRVSSLRDPHLDAMADDSTLSRNSCDCRMSTPRNPAPSICLQDLRTIARTRGGYDVPSPASRPVL